MIPWVKKSNKQRIWISKKWRIRMLDTCNSYRKNIPNVNNDSSIQIQTDCEEAQWNYNSSMTIYNKISSKSFVVNEKKDWVKLRKREI